MDLKKPLIVVGALLAIRMVDLTSPKVILFARTLFGVTASLCVAACLLIYWRIQSLNDQTELQCKVSDLDPSKAKRTGLAAMIAPNTDEVDELIKTTVQAYDFIQLKQLFTTCSVAQLITIFLHFYFGFMPPLIIQSLLNPYAVYTHPLTRIHLFKQNPIMNRQLKRPFATAAAGGLMGLVNQQQKGISQNTKESRQERRAAEREESKKKK